MTKKELIEFIVKQAQIITSQEKENERYRIAINEMAINIFKATEYIEKSIKGDNISNCSKDLIWININTEKIENLDKILEILKGEQ